METQLHKCDEIISDVTPLGPKSNKNVNTAAGSKLTHREEEKGKSICLEMCDNDEDYDVFPEMYMLYKAIMLFT